MLRPGSIEKKRSGQTDVPLLDRDESIQTVLNVVTDLVLDIQNEKFNSSALDDLTDNIIATMRQNTSIDRATVSN